MMFRTSRRQAVAGALLIAVGSAGAALAQQAFFRIGTGGTGGTYYPIGGLIANAISGQDGGKGVPGLVATAVASNGSVANINAIQGGSSESGFTQSDVAYWAYTGTGLYEGKPKVTDLRLIATLYPETVHIVARKDANIKSVADLKGKRVSIDEPGSGTIVDSRLVLAAFGLTEKDIKPEYLKPGPAGDRLKDNALDAFFFVGGYPTGAISELATSSGIALVPITGPEADKLHLRRRSRTSVSARSEGPGGYGFRVLRFAEPRNDNGEAARVTSATLLPCRTSRRRDGAECRARWSRSSP